MNLAWQTRRIGDVCSLRTGGTPSKTKPEYFGGGIRWLVSGDINQGEIFECEGRITEAGMRASNAKLLPVNSVMIALNGQGKTRGAVALLRTVATCNQSLVSIYPNEPDKLMPEFLYANLHGRYQELRQMTGDSGNDRRGLNMSLIKGIEIPVPPFPEQRRIVAILDEALAAIATARANAEHSLRDAGDLFRNYRDRMFAEGQKRWTVHDVGDLADTVTKGTTPTSVGFKFVPGGPVNFIKVESISRDGLILRDRLSQVSRECQEALSRSQLKPGDVLFSIAGALGRTAVVRADLLPANTNQAVAIIRLKASGDVLPEYLVGALETSVATTQIDLVKAGAAQQNLSLSQLRQFRIPVPSRGEQERIVEELREIRELTTSLGQVAKRKLAALDELKRSVLYQAFSGSLGHGPFERS